MKQKLLRLTRLRALVLTAVMCVLSAGQAWAETKTAGFTVIVPNSTTFSGTFTGSQNEVWDWTVSTNSEGYTSSKQGDFWQIGKNGGAAESAIFSTNGISGTIKKIVVACSSYQNKASVSATVGGNSFGTQNQPTPRWTTTGDVTFEGSATGNIIVTMTNGSGGRAMYIKSITVTYDDASGSSSDPTISSDNVEITYDATSGSIAYTLTNEVTGGVVSASVTSGDWLTLGTVGTTVPFTCNANDGVERTATVKLTYTYGSENVTKDVTVTQAGNPNGPGSENNPYTVAQARAAIDAGTGITGVYATGIVSEIVTAYSSQYHNISYNISTDGTTTADQLQAYRGKGVNGADFTSEDDIQVGDVVVIYGNLKKHNSTYEFDANNQLVSLVRSQEKQENGLSYSSESVMLTVGDAFTAPTLSNPNNLTVTYVSSNTGLATVTPAGIVSLVDGATGTATITASFAGDDTYKAGSASYTITVNKATVVYDGNYFVKVNSTSDLEDGAYLIVYEDDKLAFDGSLETLDAVGNTISVTFDENGIEANQTNKASIFIWDSAKGTLQSASGYYIGKTATGNGLNTSKTEEYTNTISISEGVATITSSGGPVLKFNDASNQIRFRYYGSGQKDIALYKLSTISVTVKADPELAFDVNEVNYAMGGTFTQPILQTASGFNGTVEYSSSDESVARIMDTETGDLRIVGEGTTTITATFAGNNDFKSGSASYTLNVTDNRIATTITQDNITIDIADIATLTQLTPVVKDANNNVVSYTNSPTAEGLPEVYFEQVSDDNGILGSFDSHGNIVLNSVVGTATIKAVYNHFQLNDNYRPSECTFTITIVDPNAPGAVNNPYKVADVLALFDNNTVPTSEVYVRGIISEIKSIDVSKYSRAQYYISDDGSTTDQFYVYNGFYINGADFTANDQIQVGDEVVVYGKLTTFNSTNEFAANNYIYSLNRPAVPAVPTITLEGATNNTIEYKAAYESYPWGASYAYTVENYSGNSAVQFTYCDASGNPVTDTPSWFNAQISDTHLMFYCRAENTSSEARYGYVKMFIEDAGTKYYSDLITVTQKGNVIDYATLPFAWAGGAKADLIAETGVTANGLGTDYASGNAPYLVKLDGTGDYIQVKTNERPGKVTIGVKMIGGSDASSITVQGSADGTTFTDIETLTISGSQNAVLELTTTNEFAETDRYVRLLFTKGSNVGVGPISIAKYTAPSTDPVINASDVNITAAATEGEITYTITNPVTGTTLTATSSDTWISNINVEADKVTFDCEANTGDKRTASITLSYAGATDKVITVTQAAYVAPFTQTTYTLASAITSGKHYIIVGEKEGTYKAMGEQNSNNRAAVDVTVANDQATVSSADVKEVVIYGPTTGGLYTIYEASTSGYLYAAGSSSNNLRTEAAASVDGCWEITFDANTGAASIKATKSSNRNVMQYNSSNSLFSCYATDSQAPVYLYEKVSDTPVAASYTRTATAGNYGTICLPYNATVVGAELYSIAGVDDKTNPTALTLDEAYFAKAGVPYIFKATDAAITAYYTGEEATTAGNANGLIGSFTSENITDAAGEPVTAGENPYVIKNNKFCKAGTNVKVGANKAYINLNDVTVSTSGAVKMFIDSDADAIDGINGEIRSGVIYNIAGQRLQRPVRGINIINGKKVLVK